MASLTLLVVRTNWFPLSFILTRLLYCCESLVSLYSYRHSGVCLSAISTFQSPISLASARQNTRIFFCFATKSTALYSLLSSFPSEVGHIQCFYSHKQFHNKSCEGFICQMAIVYPSGRNGDILCFGKSRKCPTQKGFTATTLSLVLLVFHKQALFRHASLKRGSSIAV